MSKCQNRRSNQIEVNHTLLHEAEFAGRIKIAAGTLRIKKDILEED
jgi:hypothetical protein